MDDSGPLSLFVVVFYPYVRQFSILQLEAPEDGNIEFIPAGPLQEHVVCFNEAYEHPRTEWSISPPISSTGDLYLFPDWCALKPLQGFNFNFSTGSFRNICLPLSMRADGETESVVNHGGQIYRIERRNCRTSFSVGAETLFDCYVPEKNSWKALKPFPFLPYDSRVMATAVWNDTILFNVVPVGFFAYHVHRDEWYEVDVKDNRCFSIVGEAVVLGSTIYALTDLKFGLVLALSINKEGSGGDLVFKCFVSREILVPGLRSMFSQDGNTPIPFPYKGPQDRSTHLVHLGKLDFCIVQSCDPLFPKDHKPIHVTYMSLTGKRKKKMTVTAAKMFKTRYESPNEVVLCFSLPKCRTAALEEGKPFLKELDPFNAEGHYSICVRDYPCDVPASQLVKVLKKFGQIKRDGIQVVISKKGMSLAYVEFECLISKQRAIEAKTVTLGGCPAEISESKALGSSS